MLQKLVLISLFVLIGFSQPGFSQVIAKVGEKSISLKEFKEKYRRIKEQADNPPSPELFLEDLIRYEIGLQEASKRKVEKDPRVQEQIKEVLYRAQIEMAIGQAVSKIKVNEKEMRKFYKNNPELKTSHILVSIKPDATGKQKAEAEKRAIEIYNEVKKSKRPFPELVKIYTDDVISKSTGGDIGYQSKVTLVPSYYDAANKLKIGEIKGLIKTKYGYHIIKLTGRRAYSQANKRFIRSAVFDMKRKAIFDNYFSKLKRNYRISANKKLLESIK